MNVSDVKQDNSNRIYFYLHENRVATKREIANQLELSLPTVSKTLTSLVGQGLIGCHTKISNKQGGRNPVAYTYNPDAMLAIGVDIAKHHIKTAAVDLDGNILHYTHRKKEYRRTEGQLEAIGQEVERLVREAKLNRDKVLGVGIAVPGLIDYEKDCVVDGRVVDNTGMTHAEYARYIKFRTQLVHDSEAAGFSEVFRSPELATAYYFCLGYSVGGPVFINGEGYRGDGLFSGEVGHLNLVPNGRQCYCGRKGCFDPYLNVQVLSHHTDGNLALFFEKVEQGDERLNAVWERYLDHLAQAVTEIRMMFGCKIILGADVGAFIDRYMQTLCERVDAISPFGEQSAQFLFPCHNKKEAIATGAALYFIQDFLEHYTGEAI